jgi:hypothetical protein
MNDDIVTRLRGLKTADVFLLCNEAADEIERLRAANATLSSFLHPIGTVIDGGKR